MPASARALERLRVLSLIHICKCAGIDTFIKTVVMKQNAGGYEELLKLGKRLDIRVMSSLTVMPTHRGKPAGAYLSLIHIWCAF